MNKALFILIAAIALVFGACSKQDFEEVYADPSKVSQTSVEKQFAGTLAYLARANHDKGQHSYIIPSYWNYFVVLRTTIHRYTQALGWENADNQYVPGIAAIADRWNDFYNFVAQYRELENTYSKLSADEQADMRIYMITATIFFYDQSQKVVDLHGDIPWTEAGKLSMNGGDYTKSLPKYDKAEDIYTKMLDDLKGFADELNTITVKSGIQEGFKNQDIVNNGDLLLWKKYCNSLRLRILSRVSDVQAFQARYNSEVAAILSDQAKYPVVSSNAENIKISVTDVSSDITARYFRDGLESAGWNANFAGKAMIDHMNMNNDPRLSVMFEPGVNAGGVFNGIDPMQAQSAQTAAINAGTVAIYNRSTFSRNQFFPGILISAAEVSYLISEYYLRSGNNADAKAAYENGIRQSIEYYYWIRSLSNDNTAGNVTPPTTAEINSYITSTGVNWDNAAATADKIRLIATQKWIHFSIIQSVESWAEIRRLDAPVLNFRDDNANAQKQPPYRWLYAANEQTYNTANYEAVRSKDNLTTRIFWDIK